MPTTTFWIRSCEERRVTTYLDLLGVACLALFAFAIWPPACLLVMGVAALLMSWMASS
jgi:hypothetical protein